MAPVLPVPTFCRPLLLWGSSRRSHQSPISGHLPAFLAQRNVCFRSNSSGPVSRLLSHGAPHQTALTGPFGISKGWNLLALFSSALPPAAWGSESLTRGRSEVGTGLGGVQRPRGHPLPRSLGLIAPPEVTWAESTALVGSGGVWGHVVT